jgi:sn-glycerol 3-phosphate transport system permease protein
MSRRIEWVYGWLLLTPALVLLFAFTHVPAVSTVIDSFFSTPRGAATHPSSSGSRITRGCSTDPTFREVAVNNLLYAAVTIPISIVLALVMALWADSKIPARSFVRTAYFTPTVLPMIAAANLWLFFYTPGFGVLDQIGGLFGGAFGELAGPAGDGTLGRSAR